MVLARGRGIPAALGWFRAACGLPLRALVAPSMATPFARHLSGKAKTPKPVGSVWWDEGISFKCVKCGKCCTRSDPVHVNHKEMEALAEFKQLSVAELKRAFVDEDWSGGILPFRLKRTSGGACAFHSSDGTCSVHPARPTQCRAYPFWPEHLVSRERFLAESEHCDAIRPDSTPPRKVCLPRGSAALHTLAAPSPTHTLHAPCRRAAAH